MQNILFLSQLVPYPTDAGPKVRIYYVLRYLAQKNRVTLLAFSRPDDKPGAVDHLQMFCTAVHTVPMTRSRKLDGMNMMVSILKGEAFVIRRDTVSEMYEKLYEILAQDSFDVIHADQLWMAQYAMAAKRQVPDARYVLDEHNACFQIFQRLAANEKSLLKRMFLEREWRLLKKFEARVGQQFDQIVTVTEKDRVLLEKLILSDASAKRFDKPSLSSHRSSSSKLAKFSTIPICVDPESVKPVYKQPGLQNILHLGTMFFLPNVEGVHWFAREVWPHIKAPSSDPTLTIVGKNPPKSIQNLSENSPVTIKNNSMQHSILVTGYVDDPLPYLEKADVFIIPLRSGSGMRVKILDAWLWGIPVVSTRIGAEGIDHRDGENILIADTAEEFARAVNKVLFDPSLAQKLSQNGRKWVEERYAWRRTYRNWDVVYG